MQRNKSPTAPPPPNTAVPFPSFLPISTHPPYPTPPPPFQLLRDGTVKVTRQLVYSTLTFSSDFAELPKGCVRERVWGIVTLRCWGPVTVRCVWGIVTVRCLGYCHGMSQQHHQSRRLRRPRTPRENALRSNSSLRLCESDGGGGHTSAEPASEVKQRLWLITTVVVN